MFKQYKKILSILMLAVMVLAFTGCHQDINTDEAQDINTDESQGMGKFQYLDPEAIDGENIMGIIKELTSEKYGGRLTGSRGNDRAVEYILNYFDKIGLENPEKLENYKQYYKQNVLTLNEAPVLEVVNQEGNTIKAYQYIKDFTTFIYPYSDIQGETTAVPMVIQDAGELKRSNKDIKDKILMIPKEILLEVGSRNIITIALDTGVKGLIYEEAEERKERYEHLLSYVHLGNYIGMNNEDGYIFQQVNSETFNELMIEAEKGSQIHMSINNTIELKEVANVIGLLPGNDETLKDEYIIITAHMDHCGDNRNGTYNPGALDNGSGTAVMMELARVLKESDVQPKKSIVFIAFNGEEEGLYGSNYFARNPVCSLEDAVVINMDMVGSSSKETLSITSYNEEVVQLRDELYTLAEELEINADMCAEANSDHFSFMQRRIEAITLINQDYKEIHSPLDTIDTIDKGNIEAVARLVLLYVDKNSF